MNRVGSSDREGARAARLLLGAAVVFALAVQVWLYRNAWLYFDQIILYRLGTDLLTAGELFPWAKFMSGGAVLPGSLLQLIMAAPMALWFDFRAPLLLLAVAHVALWPLLYRTLRSELSPRATNLFLILWLLSPWRVYHSGFVWEPNLLLLLAPVHLWAALRTRRAERTAHWWPSLVLGLLMLAAPQIHPSGVLLSIATSLLWLRRYLRPNRLAFSAGVLLGSVTLWHWALLALRGFTPDLGGDGTLNLFRYYVLKPIVYWVRLPGSDLGRRIAQATDLPIVSTSAGVATATILVGLWATVLMMRRLHRGEASDLDRYTTALIAATFIGHALSRNPPQGWHSLVLLAGALLPVARALDEASSRLRWSALSVLLLLHLGVIWITGSAHPMYQRPSDARELERVSPERLPSLELVPIPFGSGEEDFEAARALYLQRLP